MCFATVLVFIVGLENCAVPLLLSSVVVVVASPEWSDKVGDVLKSDDGSALSAVAVSLPT